MLRTVFQSKWVTAIGIFALVLLGTIVVRRLDPLRDAQLEVRQVQEKISEAQQLRETIKKKQEYAYSTSYLERQARLKLNYKKPGEEVVYVYRQDSQESPQPIAKPRSNLREWLDYLWGSE